MPIPEVEGGRVPSSLLEVKMRCEYDLIFKRKLRHDPCPIPEREGRCGLASY